MAMSDHAYDQEHDALLAHGWDVIDGKSRESKIPPGCYLVAPSPLEDGATWGDLRRLVDLGQHYDDDAPIKLDWTEHYATNGQITTPSGVIVEGA